MSILILLIANLILFVVLRMGRTKSERWLLSVFLSLFVYHIAVITIQLASTDLNGESERSMFQVLGRIVDDSFAGILYNWFYSLLIVAVVSVMLFGVLSGSIGKRLS